VFGILSRIELFAVLIEIHVKQGFPNEVQEVQQLPEQVQEMLLSVYLPVVSLA
jgi:hypothetical protein